MNILNEYTISSSTIAIVPNFHPQYQTKIIDVEGIYYSRESPGDILSRSCYKYGASYEGRRDAAVHSTNFIQKTPILISESEGIIALPTQSPEHEDCVWIMFHQIMEVQPSKRTCCHLKFHNYTDLEVKVSAQTIRQQIHKAAVIYSIFCTKQKISYSFVADRRRKYSGRQEKK